MKATVHIPLVQYGFIEIEGDNPNELIDLAIKYHNAVGKGLKEQEGKSKQFGHTSPPIHGEIREFEGHKMVWFEEMGKDGRWEKVK